MGQGARREQQRSQWLHAGRRFGDVIVSPDADHELNWVFNEADPQTELPSLQGAFPDVPSEYSPEAAVARADVRHAARKIAARFENMGVREWRVLGALYTERPWPRELVRRLGHLAGVVESLPGVRAEHLGARMMKRTAAATTTEWLEELAASVSADLVAWRKQAVLACERAISAYQKARGNGPSVAPRGQR